MNSARLMSFILPVVTIPAFPALCQEPTALVGTWRGPSTVDDAPEITNELTLVVTEHDGQLAGTMNDTFGVMRNAPLHDIHVHDKILNFAVTFRNGATTFLFKMNVIGAL